ncbi:MAG: MAPEG family protein [Gammaproteobacteria bacterium]|nr:MAPEG family protein [Gammaproteobacteria bacterium]
MVWVEIVTLLAVLQFMSFGFLVGSARMKHGVKAPATTGNEVFERYFRVHMNTLETLAAFLPSLWIAAHYWPAPIMAGIGAVYLAGRQIYLASYVRDPAKRSAGYGLSFLPTAVLALAGLIGALRSLLLH